MAQLSGKKLLVTGGSRGLGRAIVAAAAEAGAQVVAVARDQGRLDQLRATMAEVQTVAADVAAPEVAGQLLARYQPDMVVLAAGATPHMAPIHEQSWEQFSAIWNNDVHQAFNFGKAALTQPLAPGSRVVILSSGAAIRGSSLSGGYAGAKRTQWFLAAYFAEVATKLHLDIRFQALVPNQIIPDTDLGHAASSGYAASMGIDQATFLERFPVPLAPATVGAHVASILAGAVHPDTLAIGVTGEGLSSLD